MLLIAKQWPEPNSTAAGRRTIDIINLFQSHSYTVHVASTAEKTPFQANLAQFGCITHSINVNDPSFDHWVAALNPSIVVFDRFIMEEQFGWRVKTVIPSAMTLLDTSDLHCLRAARENSIKTDQPLDLLNDIAIREITSIVRCDLTIMISQIEIQILEQEFSIPSRQLIHLPFLVDNQSYQEGLPYNERRHLFMMGGFKHKPNRDAVRWLKSEIWPILRQKLPEHTEMHVFGAYSDHGINQLQSKQENFFIKGRANNALTTMGRYKVNLAPLRFGAGQKGKILEGWLTGTPTITTPIGAESMALEKDLGYCPTADPLQFSEQVVHAYLSEAHWNTLQSKGYETIEKYFLKSNHEHNFIDQVTSTQTKLDHHRHSNFWNRLLWQNNYRASEYMSRWIELKNQKK